MEYEDPRGHKREIEDDSHHTQDREKEIKTDDDDDDDDDDDTDNDYHYTDWASI